MAARILIVEDEASIAENLRFALSADGFHPHCCANGESALLALSQEPIELIILDIGLPDGNGFELFHQVRAVTAAPVIFLTARADEIDRIAGLELGADDYVTKPFSPRELLARIRTVLRRIHRVHPIQHAEPNTSHRETVPFRIDEEKRRIHFFDHPLDLTRYEYGLLRILIRRPGRVFTREELLFQVWESPDACYDRTVDAHIKSLRAKLKALRPDLEPISTHWGTGYALNEAL
jgi:two-component system catabolic regulation response regulator CreB